MEKVLSESSNVIMIELEGEVKSENASSKLSEETKNHILMDWALFQPFGFASFYNKDLDKTIVKVFK